MDDVRLCLSDEVWERFAPAIENAKRSRRGAPPKVDERMFVEGLLYLARTSVPWRDLPECFGAWDAVYNRFRRWLDAGVWERLFKSLAGDELLEPIARVFLDSTIIRAHPHAAGAPAKKGGKKRKRWAVARADSVPSSI
ncbi:hypothetical protein AYO40_00760 [Planctomycetaceae bacterium SCGC AG-212-D15]|nr:hypothetical protein AYO40_00760 [Planctomycetaceae bacterium SCGC AG-212-D15]